MTDPTMEPITARYEWNPEGLADALDAHRKQLGSTFGRLILRGLLVVLGVVTVVIPVGIVTSSDNLNETKGALIFWVVMFGYLWGMIYLVFWSKALRRRNATRAFGHLSQDARHVEWTFNPDEIGNRTVLTAATFLWPLFLKAVESPKGVSLYQNVGFFHWIPGHAFASAVELKRFTDLARSKIANYIVLGECQYPTKPDPTGLDEL